MERPVSRSRPRPSDPRRVGAFAALVLLLVGVVSSPSAHAASGKQLADDLASADSERRHAALLELLTEKRHLKNDGLWQKLVPSVVGALTDPSDGVRLLAWYGLAWRPNKDGSVSTDALRQDPSLCRAAVSALTDQATWPMNPGRRPSKGLDQDGDRFVQRHLVSAAGFLTEQRCAEDGVDDWIWDAMRATYDPDLVEDAKIADWLLAQRGPNAVAELVRTVASMHGNDTRSKFSALFADRSLDAEEREALWPLLADTSDEGLALAPSDLYWIYGWRDWVFLQLRTEDTDVLPGLLTPVVSDKATAALFVELSSRTLSRGQRRAVMKSLPPPLDHGPSSPPVVAWFQSQLDAGAGPEFLAMVNDRELPLEARRQLWTALFVAEPVRTDSLEVAWTLLDETAAQLSAAEIKWLHWQKSDADTARIVALLAASRPGSPYGCLGALKGRSLSGAQELVVLEHELRLVHSLDRARKLLSGPSGTQARSLRGDAAQYLTVLKSLIAVEDRLLGVAEAQDWARLAERARQEGVQLRGAMLEPGLPVPVGGAMRKWLEALPAAQRGLRSHDSSLKRELERCDRALSAIGDPLQRHEFEYELFRADRVWFSALARALYGLPQPQPHKLHAEAGE